MTSEEKKDSIATDTKSYAPKTMFDAYKEVVFTLLVLIIPQLIFVLNSGGLFAVNLAKHEFHLGEVIIIAGSFVMSLVWPMFLRGCLKVSVRNVRSFCK